MKKGVVYGILFGVAIIWGFGYIFSEIALTNNWSVFSILFQRNALSFIVTFLFSFKTKFWKNKKTLIVGLVAGLIYFFGYVFQLYGQKYTTVSNTGLITSLGVIFVPLFYWMFFKKKPQTYAFMACVIGLVGAFILSYNPGFEFHLGDILVLSAAILYAIHLTYIGKEGDDLDLFGLVSTQFFVMAVLSLIGIIVTRSEFVGDPRGWYGVLPYALLSGAIGITGQVYSQRIIESYKVSLVLTLEGLFAVIFSIIFLREPITWQVLVGGSIMLGSVFFNQIMDIKTSSKLKGE